MEFLVVLIIGGLLGYAFRGSIGKELKVIGADIKAELSKLAADVKARI